MNYQRFYPEFILNVQAFFEEIGTTGTRDSVVYEICRRQGLVGADGDFFKGWAKDPYDDTDAGYKFPHPVHIQEHFCHPELRALCHRSL